MKTKTTKTNKTKKTDEPLTRSEFKDAISKLSRNELIGLVCDIYYAHAKDVMGSKGGCECDCGCGSDNEPKTSSKAPKSKVSKKK